MERMSDRRNWPLPRSKRRSSYECSP